MNSEKVHIEKLVHGGQGLGHLSDGQAVFVWNALPGEQVQAEIYRRKKDYAEAIATKIIKASTERIEPVEPESYLATSPWQIMTLAAESKYKKTIIQETFLREKIHLPNFDFFSSARVVPGKAGPGSPKANLDLVQEGPMENPSGVFHYRNKMEYSFFGDDDGLHLALHKRGSHRKIIVSGSQLARPEIDEAARRVVALLRTKNVRAGDLKSLIIRCNQKGEVVAALFVKPENFPDVSEAGQFLEGLTIYHSNPKSPAAVATRLLQTTGDTLLTETIGSKRIQYDVTSFFQVNLPIFEIALEHIKQHLIKQSALVDMYAGVGTISLSLEAPAVVLVEVDVANTAIARKNASGQAEVVQASSEKALDYIKKDAVIIVDPPRAGLHAKLVERLAEVRPRQIIYLSCNPITQARDVEPLLAKYEMKFFAGYNFFPRTPHIEALAILTAR